MEFEVLIFVEGGKPENQEKNLSRAGRKPTTNSTHMWHQTGIKPSHINGRQLLSPLRHHCHPQSNFIFQDNLVTLHVMLTSPHVADLKPLVETWITNLQQVENITDIWADCQKKV